VTVLIGEAALRNLVGSPEVIRNQIEHIAQLATTVTHATIGIVPFQRLPVLVQHGWDQRDRIITLETTAGDLEIADPRGCSIRTLVRSASQRRAPGCRGDRTVPGPRPFQAGPLALHHAADSAATGVSI
jgi:hypothetical protein